MDLIIRNDNGDVLSKVLDVTLFAVVQTVTTEHGSFDVNETAIDYVKSEINVYSTGYTINRIWEKRYNQYGVYLESKL